MKKIIAILVALSVGTAVYGIDVKTMFIDQPPKFTLKNGVFSGLAIDIIRGIEKVDPSIHFVTASKDFTPIARVEKSLESGDIDAYVGFTKNPEREAKFMMTVPLFSTSNVVISLAADTAAFQSIDEFKAVNKDAPVLAVSNSAQAQYLKKQGFKVDDGSASFGVAFDKLISGRTRFLMVPDLAAYTVIKEQGLGAKVRVHPSFTGKEDQFFCFSKKTSQDVVDQVLAALKKMKKAGDIDAIVAPYMAVK